VTYLVPVMSFKIISRVFLSEFTAVVNRVHSFMCDDLELGER